MVKNYPCTSVFPHFLPSSPSQRLLCLDTTRSRLPARRNASQPSTDVRARTPQTPNRGQRCPLSLTIILTCPLAPKRRSTSFEESAHQLPRNRSCPYSSTWHHSDNTPRTFLASPTTPSPQSSTFRYPQSTFGPPVKRNTSFTDLLAYLLSPPDEVQ